MSDISTGLSKDLDTLLQVAEKECPEMHIISHSKNVAHYSRLIFEYLPEYEKTNWNNITAKQVFDAGMYHDIGKVFISKYYPTMLGKKKFDSTDRFCIQEHVAGGMIVLQILASLNDLSDINTLSYKLICDACLYHHERTDGSGYLKSSMENIPRIGLLVGVADCFSAGIEKRIYSDPKTAITVLNELKEQPLKQTYVNALERALMVHGVVKLS